MTNYSIGYISDYLRTLFKTLLVIGLFIPGLIYNSFSKRLLCILWHHWPDPRTGWVYKDYQKKETEVQYCTHGCGTWRWHHTTNVEWIYR